MGLAYGGLAGLANTAKVVLLSILGAILAVAVLVAVSLVVSRIRRHLGGAAQPTEIQPPKPVWTAERIAERLYKIDWYQFEKLNAEILRNEGWTVERKGGATPDGGVDLIATKGETRVLIQCKHWRSWNVQEKVIREMLGSMTHFGVSSGAIHTLKGWTAPAARFAQEHSIRLCDATNLTQRACRSISGEDLDRLLSDDSHHCPKCEAPMIWRTGDFEPFWGCSRFPRCRSVIREPKTESA